MSFQHEYPYGDVHEMNLDWLIQTMQDFINSERAAGNTPTVASVRSYFTHKYPYGDIHELNLDWVIQTALRMEEIGDSVEGDIGELQTRMTTAEGNISTLDNTVSELSDTIAEIGTEIENINDDVEELQTAVGQHTSQIKALDDKIDTQVVANPADVATDTLSKIEIAGTVYGIQGSGGSEVEPNPAGEPTDTLETIGIDGTVYEVGGSEPVSKTATGNPIHIEDAADAPIVSGEVTFEPKQDLHGYDKPWAGGAGKNKMPFPTISRLKELNTSGTWVDNAYTINGITYTFVYKNDNIEYVNVNGTASDSATILIFNRNATPYFTLPTGTYILNGIQANSGVRQQFQCTRNGSLHSFDSDIGYGSTAEIYDTDLLQTTINVQSGVNVSNSKLYPMIRLATETDSTFEPYSNICPIEGYTDCEVDVTGKNLLPMILDDIKAVNTSGTWSDNVYTYNGIDFTVNTDDAGNVTGITANGTASTNSSIVMTATTAHDWNDAIVSGCPTGGSNTTYRVTVYDTTNDLNYIDTGSGVSLPNNISTSDTRFVVQVRSRYTATDLTFYPMLRLATETDPTFEPYQSTTYTIDLDGTRYGGKVYPVTGKMPVGMGHIASYAGETIGEPWLSDRDVYVTGTTPTIGAEVVYTLASPTVVQLVREQIRTLQGTNNISTNMTGMTVEYITQDYQPLVKLIERSVGHHYST